MKIKLSVSFYIIEYLLVPLYDSHLHLQDPRLKSVFGNLSEVYDKLGVARVVVNGTEEADWEGVGQLAEMFSFVNPSFGVHPWKIFDRSQHWLGNLEYCIDHYHGYVGEIGLDRWIEHNDFDDQIKVFRNQLQLATRKDVPASIHCLNAWGKLLEILEEEPLPLRGLLLHSYSGSVEIVPKLVELGCYFSFSGHFLLNRKAKARATFQAIPIQRILVETDGPSQMLPEELVEYPLPEDSEGNAVNHPGNIGAVYKGLAKVLGQPLDTFELQVAKNFEQLFGEVRVKGKAK
jgi:TatD DNase family protein